MTGFLRLGAAKGYRPLWCRDISLSAPLPAQHDRRKQAIALNAGSPDVRWCRTETKDCHLYSHYEEHSSPAPCRLIRDCTTAAPRSIQKNSPGLFERRSNQPLPSRSISPFFIACGLGKHILTAVAVLLVSQPILAQVPAPTGIEVKFGPSAISLEATRTDSLTDHRAFRMHFYLKLGSKASWDDQASPGGSATGSDSPLTESDVTDTGLWTALTVDTAYDVRVRVAAYSDEEDSMGDPIGWVYSDWVERRVTTSAAATVPAPTGIDLAYGPSAVKLEATRTDSLTQHRAFRMHFYLKLGSKASWDDQASPGGSATGSDSPLTESDVTDTGLWTGLTVNTAYDVRVRVAAYSDVLDSNGDVTGWVYSDWVERQVTTSAAATVPVPTVDRLRSGETAVGFRLIRTDSLAQHRNLRMHFYLKLASKAAWDAQMNPGGSASGTDNPQTLSDVTARAVWTGLTANTSYDVRVRVAAYSDVLDSSGDATGWVYSDWVERQISTTTGAAIAVPAPTGIDLKFGPSAVKLEATRTDSLTQHRAFRMHFYLKLDSKASWDDQASPGGDPGGSDSPLREDDATDAGLWTELTVNTAYDVRVRAVAYSDVLD